MHARTQATDRETDGRGKLPSIWCTNFRFFVHGRDDKERGGEREQQFIDFVRHAGYCRSRRSENPAERSNNDDDGDEAKPGGKKLTAPAGH